MDKARTTMKLWARPLDSSRFQYVSNHVIDSEDNAEPLSGIGRLSDESGMNIMANCGAPRMESSMFSSIQRIFPL